MEYLLETNGLTKQYGRTKAVNAVNMHIKQGDIYGLIGRNGAGKTTILKMLGGLAAPTEGSFSLFGHRGKEVAEMMHRIGTLIESPGLYPNLSAAENLKLKCIAMGVRDREAVPRLLECVGLANAGKKHAGKFSMGMKQRLGIAIALVGEPDVVMLDEPINGLDPQGIVEIRETIEKLNEEQGITFIVSSHILEELSKIATRYGIIHNGILLQEMSRKELLEKCGERIELKADDTAKACTVLEEMGIKEYQVVDKDTIQIFERLDDSGEITVFLAKNNVKTLSIQIKNEALEDYYLNLTGGGEHV